LAKLQLHWQILIGMVLGAVIGIGVNGMLSQRDTELTEDLPPGIDRARVVVTADLIRVSWSGAEGVREHIVDPTGQAEGSVLSVEDLALRSPVAAALVKRAPSYAQTIGAWAKRIGGLFLRMLQMISVPLIISSLASGVLGLGGAARLRRMFGWTITYYIATSLLAIATGLLVTNIINPGLNSNLRLEASTAKVGSAGIVETMMTQVERMIPTNPIAAAADSSFLSIIVFTVVFSIFVLQIGGSTVERFKLLAEDTFQVMMRLTTAIIRLAPYGVMLLMLYVTATQGLAVFSALAWYFLAVTSGLTIHAFITLPLLYLLLVRRNPLDFMQAMMPALLTAFSSASSNAALPLTLNNLEERAGVSNKTSSFVVPLGATINMDGTALYEAVAVLFIGQLASGAGLSITDQIVIALTALLASVGAAGIPHAGLVMMAIVLQAVNLPLEYQGIILAVDRLLDMYRTSVNVWSDSCGTAVVDRLIQGD
jgi:proton glutamate symport protein